MRMPLASGNWVLLQILLGLMLACLGWRGYRAPALPFIFVVLTMAVFACYCERNI